MNKARRVLVTGVGAMTPAFILGDVAQAGADPRSNTAVHGSLSNLAFDQSALKSTLLALSPIEKLRIAGDRIRLSADEIKPRGSRVTPTATPTTNPRPPNVTTTCVVAPGAKNYNAIVAPPQGNVLQKGTIGGSIGPTKPPLPTTGVRHQ